MSDLSAGGVPAVPQRPVDALIAHLREVVGQDIDEPLLELGRSLRLPPWLEPSRADIEAAVPPLRLPDEEPAPADGSAA